MISWWFDGDLAVIHPHKKVISLGIYEVKYDGIYHLHNWSPSGNLLQFAIENGHW